MAMAAKKAWLRCCECGYGCPGCCFPTTEDGLDFLPIPFCIEAPSCPATDGTCGEFTDEAIEPQNKRCGSCGSFDWFNGVLSVASVFYNPDGMGGCDRLPGLGLDVRFKLYCTDEMGVSDSGNLTDCCRRLRLLCGTSYETADYDPTIVLQDFGQYITVIAPDSCTCGDVFSARFSLCRLVPAPKANPNPECAYTPGFEVPDCDFCEMDLVI